MISCSLSYSSTWAVSASYGESQMLPVRERNCTDCGSSAPSTTAFVAIR